MKKHTIFITIIIAIILTISYLTIYKLKKTEQVSDQSIMSLQDKAADSAKKGKFKKAENLYLKAISYAKQLYGEKHCLAASPAYVGLSNIYIKQGKYGDAITQLKAAVKSYKNSVVNNILPINLLKLKILLANGYKYKQDYKNAEKHYLAVSPHVEKLPLNVQYDYYIKYGDVCFQQNKNKEAIILFNKAELFKDKISTHKLMQLHENLIYAYCKLHKFKLAIPYIKQVLSLELNTNGKSYEYIYYLHLYGRILIGDKQFKKADIKLINAIDLYMKNKLCNPYKNLKFYIYLDLAHLSMQQKNKVKFDEYWGKIIHNKSKKLLNSKLFKKLENQKKELKW